MVVSADLERRLGEPRARPPVVLREGGLYEAAEFLDVAVYRHVQRWAADMASRPTIERAKRLNCSWGDKAARGIERHDAADFDPPVTEEG